MGEGDQPLSRDGLRVKLFAALDGLQRKQVEGHHPGQVEMGAGGDQVADVAGTLAAALHHHRLHVAGVAGIDFHRDAGEDLFVAVQQMHLAALDEGIVVLAQVAHAVALVLLFGLLNMMRGGSPNTSQKLMRLRVLLQFVAIVVIMATVWVMGSR